MLRIYLFVHYLSSLICLSFRKSFGLFAPLHQWVMEEGLKHTYRGKHQQITLNTVTLCTCL